MPKRPSLFAPPKTAIAAAADSEPPAILVPHPEAPAARVSSRPPSRAGKRVLSIYLDPLAWRQLRELALREETSTQALGEEAVNLLFAARGLNRSA